MSRITNSFRQTVTITASPGTNAYGDRVAGAETESLARLEPHQALVRDKHGQEKLVSARLFLAAGVAILPNYTVAYGGQSYTVLQGGDLIDHKGNVSHQEWLLGAG